MAERREQQRAAYAIARDQWGAIARRQLLSAGIGPRLIESWLKTGRVLPAYRSVYSLGRPFDSIEGWWTAATLAAGTGAVLAGSTAAAALGFGKLKGVIEVARPGGRSRTIEPALPSGRRAEIRKAVLLPRDVMMAGSIPVMSTARTLQDIAVRSSPSQLRSVFIEAGRHGHLSRSVLETCRNDYLGYTNHSRLVWLVDAWSSGSSGRIRSHLEGDFRIFCFEWKVPPPETNVRVAGREVDALWRDQRLIVELDSRQFHGDGLAFENDRGKSNDLTLEGYTVLRFTWKMLKEDPQGVATAIFLALGCN